MFQDIIDKFKIGAVNKVSPDEQINTRVEDTIKSRIAHDIAAAIADRKDLYEVNRDLETGVVEHKMEVVVIPSILFPAVMTELISRHEREEATRILNGVAPETMERQLEDCDRICTAILNGDYESGTQAINAIMKLYVPDTTFSRGGVSRAIAKLREHNW